MAEPDVTIEHTSGVGTSEAQFLDPAMHSLAGLDARILSVTDTYEPTGVDDFYAIADLLDTVDRLYVKAGVLDGSVKLTLSGKHLEFLQGSVVRPSANVDMFDVTYNSSLIGLNFDGSSFLSGGAPAYTANVVNVLEDANWYFNRNTQFHHWHFNNKVGTNTPVGTAVKMYSVTDGKFIAHAKITNVDAVGFNKALDIYAAALVGTAPWVNGCLFDDWQTVYCKYGAYLWARDNTGTAGQVASNIFSNWAYESCGYSVSALYLKGGAAAGNIIYCRVGDWLLIAPGGAKVIVFTNDSGAPACYNYIELVSQYGDLIGGEKISDAGLGNVIHQIGSYVPNPVSANYGDKWWAPGQTIYPQHTYEAHTASDTITNNEHCSTHSNVGAGGAITFTLPDDDVTAPTQLLPGFKVHFVVGAAQELRVDPQDDGGFYINGAKQNDGKYISSSTIGDSCTVTYAGSQDWFVSEKVGTWTVQS